MPTYEYRCSECGHTFDVFQRMSDDPRAECGECGSAAERLISGGGGLLFKGEGFYITDYRSESYKKAEREGAGEAPSARGEAEAGGGAQAGGDGGSGRTEDGKPRTAKPDAGTAPDPASTGSGGRARESRGRSPARTGHSGRARERRGGGSGGSAEKPRDAKRGRAGK